MKAITTRYYGPTNSRGSHVLAVEPDGQKLYTSWEHGLDSEANHREAAQALCDKLGWTGEFLSGWAGGNEYAHVFLTWGTRPVPDHHDGGCTEDHISCFDCRDFGCGCEHEADCECDHTAARPRE